MSETARIVRQMKQSLDGPCWVGPALLEILEGVDASVAAARPSKELHSIWEIVLHLTGTQRVMLRRFAGDTTPLTPEEDWPAQPSQPSEEAWQDTLRLLRDQEARLRANVEMLPAKDLDQPLVHEGSSAYNNLHGHVQHTLYHAGQMALLKRLVTNA